MLPHLLVPLRNRQIIEHVHPDPKRLADVLAHIGAEGCYVFSLDPISPTSTAHARFFNPTVGIIEDAATGTAAGPSACLLTRHGVVKEDQTVVVEQGFQMGRPSLLRLNVKGDVAKLSGSGIQVIEGKIRVI